MFTFVYRILGIIALFWYSIVHTFAVPIVISPTNNLPDINSSDPGDSIASIISYGIGLVGILAIIWVTWWGIVIITGAGDEEKMKQWRKIVIYSLVGVFVAGIAYLAVSFFANLNLSL